MEQSADPEEAWRELLEAKLSDGSPYWWVENPIVRAASRHPRVRQLFPLPTHGTLRLFRTPWRYPDKPAHDLPFLICSGPPYLVLTDYGQPPLGEADTADEAVAILVANLPA